MAVCKGARILHINFAMPSDLDTLNQRFYLSRSVADWYATKAFIFPEEQAFLALHGVEAVDGKNVLDIGIGAGRTTRFLQPRAARYIGVDYSPNMIAAAASHHPEATLHVRDARDLSAYKDGEFDTVMFSFNGIDCLSYEGRLAAMKEIQRVLKPGGWFIFSSHNRDQKTPGPFAVCNLSFSKHPLRMLAHLLRYLKGIVNRWKTKSLAYAGQGHEMRHDSSNIFAAPICYITKAAQRDQLAVLGLEMISIFDRAGKATSVAEFDQTSSWILYVCRKGGVTERA
jgi:ubiquinone/menaquinone biosynthesis C-methylase UbiE|uniref:class I SAM-dependent methyltransferase n=1 Tax=Prosthecobacter sp. TaxID=1965333 RepID=UPI00378313E6